jgi:hypothetical protein
LDKKLASEVAKLKKEMNTTVKGLQDQIIVLNAGNNQINLYIDEIYKTLSAVDARVAGLSTLAGIIPEIQGKLEHFHSVNQLWKQNFAIVNKTFETMKKRLNMNG